ncbi:hypothetical protein [Ureibacillus terrenus]|uniref:Uncharacterized protein n=1 Tax=Ureibacillus terrenus TaxID=118246 RepID=A0A540UVH5_9BACL|nr:hypothetical protein [Ureibacillus terrenus]TQE88417.1 hypothetical protein FKZ59_13760 [Ureibacillus terrenus]
MLGKIGQILLIIAACCIFSIINFGSYTKGGIPSLNQAIASIVFLFLLLIYGFWMGRKKDVFFLKFSSIYWGIGLFLIILSYSTSAESIGIPAVILYAGPVYGINYFLKFPTDSGLVFLSIIISYVIGLAGFSIGRLLKKSIHHHIL